MYRRGSEEEEWKKRRGDVGGRKSTRHSLPRVNSLDRVQSRVEVTAVGGSQCCGCLGVGVDVDVGGGSVCEGDGRRGSSEEVMDGGINLGRLWVE